MRISLLIGVLACFAQPVWAQGPGKSPSGAPDPQAEIPIPNTQPLPARYEQHLLPASSGMPGGHGVKVTFFGTTTLLFDDGKTQIMTDGFFTRPSSGKVALTRLETNKPLVDSLLKEAGVTRLQALFVTHSHYDHALDAAYVVTKSETATLHGSDSTLNIGRGGGVPEERLALFKPGKEVAVGDFRVTVINSRHSPPLAGVNDDLGKWIDKPLKQPARYTQYAEGGCYDVHIRHGRHTLLLKPSAQFIRQALDDVQADVLFLATATLGTKGEPFASQYYGQTVLKVRPKLVVAVHWDNFFRPLDEPLVPLSLGDTRAAFDFLIRETATNGIRFGLLQGRQSVMLFE